MWWPTRWNRPANARAELHHRNLNVGASLSIFDRIFGTNYRPAAGEVFRLGLDADHLGEANPHNSVRDLYPEPPATLARMLWRKLGGTRPGMEPATVAKPDDGPKRAP